VTLKWLGLESTGHVGQGNFGKVFQFSPPDRWWLGLSFFSGEREGGRRGEFLSPALSSSPPPFPHLWN